MGNFVSLTNLRGMMLLLTCTIQLGASPNSYVPPSSDPKHLHVFGDYVYFSADDGVYGRELWRVDVGGNKQLVCDITQGPKGAELDNFCNYKGKIYFRVSDENRAGDLWCSDGTSEGTRPVRTFGEHAGQSGVSLIVSEPGEKLFFAVGDSKGTSVFWTTDGTSTGTYPLELGRTADPLLMEHYCGCITNGIHYFAARQQRTFGLWRSDGTVEGTRVLKSFDRMPGGMQVLDRDRFVFAGGDSATGMELWVSAGSEDTTILLKEIYPGSESSDPADFSGFNAKDGTPKVAFAATSPKSGRELWETDGTPEGTRQLVDLIQGSGGSSPSSLVEAGNYRYFSAVGEGIGNELFRYVVDADRFDPAMDINSGIASSSPYALCAMDGDLYFSALDSKGGEEFWVCRGVDSGPKLFADIYPGPRDSFPYYTVLFKGRVVTVATSPVYGRELWISDITRTKMELLSDINSDDNVNPSSFPEKFTPSGDLLFFTANDIAHGTELWRTDGTKEGTVMVKDIFLDSPSSNPDGLTDVNGTLYFSADDGTHGMELWQSDGTADGTSMVQDIHPTGAGKPRNLIAFKGRLFFSVFEPDEGEELWSVEPGGLPRNVLNIAGGDASSSPDKFFIWKDFLYFQADDGVHGRELWRTDGTGEGTVMVSDIVDAPYQGVVSQPHPMGYKGKLFLAADFDGSGTELWSLNETQMKFELVRDIVSDEVYNVIRPIGIELPESHSGLTSPH